MPIKCVFKRQYEAKSSFVSGYSLVWPLHLWPSSPVDLVEWTCPHPLWERTEATRCICWKLKGRSLSVLRTITSSLWKCVGHEAFLLLGHQWLIQESEISVSQICKFWLQFWSPQAAASLALESEYKVVIPRMAEYWWSSKK